MAPATLAHAQQATGKIAGTVVDVATGEPMPGASVGLVGTTIGGVTDIDGKYVILNVPVGMHDVRATFIGFEAKVVAGVEVKSGQTTEVNFELTGGAVGLGELVVQAERPMVQRDVLASAIRRTTDGASRRERRRAERPQTVWDRPRSDFSTEDYAHITENPFRRASENPFSTFSIDVDAASYTNIRRFIQRERQVPPVDAVRIEEMINYFDYDYPQPEGKHPFLITLEVGEAPWNTDHRLVHIGLQGKRLHEEERPANNLVFLLDVSGSMRSWDKIDLLKEAFLLLTDELTEDDRVAIVVYAGASGLVLPSTPGSDKQRIKAAITRLNAGGSTAGAAGIQLAYKVAQEHFVEGGNNRVILATDGDFNMGTSSDSELIRLIEEKRESGVFLTVLGLGTGNLKDNKMEQIANHGNGNYYYLDSLDEAEKVLVNELGSTLYTIAKDVKLQVEFNPLHVASYRLIGYENRLLNDEDFDDDTKDAGELGAGHTVTALYEVVPVGAASNARSRGDLKYQQQALSAAAHTSGELMTVKLRYKRPSGFRSRLIEQTVPAGAGGARSDDFYFSAAVAAFGMILRDSEHRGEATVDQVLALAKDALGADPGGYRASFVDLVERYEALPQRSTASR